MALEQSCFPRMSQKRNFSTQVTSCLETNMPDNNQRKESGIDLLICAALMLSLSSLTVFLVLMFQMQGAIRIEGAHPLERNREAEEDTLIDETQLILEFDEGDDGDEPFNKDDDIQIGSDIHPFPEMLDAAFETGYKDAEACLSECASLMPDRNSFVECLKNCRARLANEKIPLS